MRWRPISEESPTRLILSMGTLLIALLALATSLEAKADPLQDVDRVLRTVKQPVATAASICSLAVNVQVALGEDDVRNRCSIRKVSEPINQVSRKRDTLAGTSRHVALVWRQLTNR